MAEPVPLGVVCPVSSLESIRSKLVEVFPAKSEILQTITSLKKVVVALAVILRTHPDRV